MEKEILFAQTLEKVKKLAKEQGNSISEEQIQEAFEELELQDRQLELVYDYLKQNKIGIGEQVNVDDYLTAEEKDYLQEYLLSIALMEEIRDGEKEAITLSAMAGDGDAQNKLIELYLNEVVDIAKLYAGQGVLMEDLIGEGNVALTMGVQMLGCLEHADEAQGMIGRIIMDAMEDYIAVNAEESKKDSRIAQKVNKVADAARELAETLGKKVTIAELSQETGMSDAFIRDAVRMSGYKIEEIEETDNGYNGEQGL